MHERTEGGVPGLDEVRDAVALEWRAARRQAVNEAFYQGLRDRYEVIVERSPGVEGAAAASAEGQR